MDRLCVPSPPAQDGPDSGGLRTSSVTADTDVAGEVSRVTVRCCQRLTPKKNCGKCSVGGKCGVRVRSQKGQENGDQPFLKAPMRESYRESQMSGFETCVPEPHVPRRDGDL